MVERPGPGASVDALIARGKYERAIELLVAEVYGGRRTPRVWLQLADVLVLAGRADQAVPVLLALADEFARSGFVAKAISVLKRVEKIAPGRRDVDAKLAALIKEKQQERRPFQPPAASVAPAALEPHPMPPASKDTASPASPPPTPASRPGVSVAEEELSAIADTLEEAAREEAQQVVLEHSPFFDDFTEDELLAVIRGLRLVSFEPGDVIVGAGDAGDSLFVLTSGSAKAFVRDATGRHVPVRQMGEGAFFGEISILTGRPRTATVTARTRCDALELDRATLDRISAGRPRVMDVLKAFCEHRMESDAWLASRSAESNTRS